MAHPLSSRIAYQGEPGAFSEEAALLLAPLATLVPCHYFPELFSAIRNQQADLLLAPIENTLAGAVTDSYDLLLQSGLFITAEAILPIQHQLIGLPGANLADIRTVFSHPVALAQCRRFFAAHPALDAQAAHDTAGSVRRMVERGDPSIAAIASSRAAVVYGGEVLAQNIEDSAHNFTRFLLLSENERADEGDKFSLAVRLKQTSLLTSLLGMVEGWGATLVNLVSRPAPGSLWEYFFFLDFRGPCPNGRDGLLQFSTELKWLGSYKSAAA